MDVKKTDYAIEKEQRLSVTFKPDEESKDISLIYKCEPNINHLEFEHKLPKTFHVSSQPNQCAMFTKRTPLFAIK